MAPSNIKSRKATTRQLEIQLKAALKELQAANTLNDQLLRERDDCEEEQKKMLAKNTVLRNDLVEYDYKLLDSQFKVEQLQTLLDNFNQCASTHEVALNRIINLEEELGAANEELNYLRKERAFYMSSKPCYGIEFIDIKKVESKLHHFQNLTRKYWYSNFDEFNPKISGKDDKDVHLKLKIYNLIDQTVHSTGHKLQGMNSIKEKRKSEPGYRIGILLSIIKTCNGMMSEIFNVAVKHRDDWKAIEMLKIYEILVHTNVDITNYIRQLVEIHIQALNQSQKGAKNVVLMKKK